MSTATFQSTVNINLGFGVVGEALFNSPTRSEVLTLDANGGTVGNYFTKSNSTGIATQGGTIAAGVVAAGFLVNPKVYASNGGTNPLEGAAFTLQIAQKMMRHRASGVRLKGLAGG